MKKANFDQYLFITSVPSELAKMFNYCAVFTQRNFVADFIGLNLNFINKNDKFAFRTTL